MTRFVLSEFKLYCGKLLSSKHLNPMMEWCGLELKVISCKHLKAFNFFQKLSVYAAVSITDGEQKKPQCLQRQKTPIHRRGGTKPEWNHLMNFDLKALEEDCSRYLINFDIHCEGIVYGRKTVGKVRVPLKDLLEEFHGAVRFVSYQVRTSDGKPNGVLNFSYKIKGTSSNKVEDVAASPGVNLSVGDQSYLDTRKVHYYPSVDVDVGGDQICYPSLDDIQIQSPLPLTGFYSPSPNHEYRSDVYWSINPGQMSPLVGVQTPGRWYMVESTGYGYGWRGHNTNNNSLV